MIAQSWLNIAGLLLDFSGVMLLAWEWWLALSAERLEAELEDRERRLAPHPSMPRPNNPHQPVSITCAPSTPLTSRVAAELLHAACGEGGSPQPWS